MNRRNVIKRFALLGFGASLTYLGVKFYKVKAVADLHNLEQYKPQIDDLAELIIPRTDTPGAKDAAVGDFIILMVRDATDTMSQNNFVAGLMEIMEEAESKLGKAFNECSFEEQNSLLTKYSAADFRLTPFFHAVRKKLIGKSFFTVLKEYTVLGYCTSEVGATLGMSYDYIPGKYQGDLLLQTGQKAWATQ